MEIYTFEQWLAIVGVAVAALTATAGTLKWWSDRSSAKRNLHLEQEIAKIKLRYEGDALLRSELFETVKEIYSCVGRLNEPRDVVDFDDAWHLLGVLWQGKSFLINDSKLRKSFDEFCEFFWNNDDHDKLFEPKISDANYKVLTELSDDLCKQLNRYIRAQFAQTGKVADLDSKKGRKGRAIT